MRVSLYLLKFGWRCWWCRRHADTCSSSSSSDKKQRFARWWSMAIWKANSRRKSAVLSRLLRPMHLKLFPGRNWCIHLFNIYIYNIYVFIYLYLARFLSFFLSYSLWIFSSMPWTHLLRFSSRGVGRLVLAENGNTLKQKPDQNNPIDLDEMLVRDTVALLWL